MNLTAAQRQIAELIARGQSNKEIGSDLGLSEQTVKWHVSRMLKRYSLPNRAALAISFVKDSNSESAAKSGSEAEHNGAGLDRNHSRRRVV